MHLRFYHKKRQEKRSLQQQQAPVISIQSSQKGLEYLISLFQKIRPSKAAAFEEAEMKFQSVLFQLQTEKAHLFALRKALLHQFSGTDITMALTESGLLSGRGFIQELSSKLKHKLLPPLLPESNFLFVLERIFYKKDDYVWVGQIDKSLWVRFFDLIGIKVNLSEPGLIRQINYSLRVLSHRLSVLGLEKEFYLFGKPGTSVAFPFLEQNRLVEMYLDTPIKPVVDQNQKILFATITEALHNCTQSIHWLKEAHQKHGTSLAETFLITRMEKVIDRMLLLMDVLNRDEEFNTERFIQYFITVVQDQNRKNSIREFLSQNLGILAYQISEHGGKKGADYITVSGKDFNRLFVSAMKGGLIISFVAISKNLLGKLLFTPFWNGILYSLNYATGFVLLQVTGSTLATKQPAFTASAVAASLDSRKLNGAPDLYSLAITVARVARSQIASFAGNLLVVFPVTFLLAMLYHQVTGGRIVEGVPAVQALEAQHVFSSLSLLYACYTGFFLFLSGLIAGWVENYVVYGKLPERVQNHPSLVHRLSKKQLNWLVTRIENSLGSLAGSVSLGFFLGMAAFLGQTFAIPFDIRHITISAGNVAIGWYGLDQFPGWYYTIMILFSVGLIGFLNFFVSFSLTFYVAVKSRGIRLKKYPEFLGILRRYFSKYPGDFIRPPRQVRTAEQLQINRIV